MRKKVSESLRNIKLKQKQGIKMDVFMRHKYHKRMLNPVPVSTDWWENIQSGALQQKAILQTRILLEHGAMAAVWLSLPYQLMEVFLLLQINLVV